MIAFWIKSLIVFTLGPEAVASSAALFSWGALIALGVWLVLEALEFVLARRIRLPGHY